MPLIHLILKDMETGTTESELMKKIFKFIHELIDEPVLEKYVYAFGGMPLKKL